MGRNTVAVVRCLSPHHVGQDAMSICCLITGGANLDALVEAMSVGFPHCEVTIFAFAITRVVSWKRGFKNMRTLFFLKPSPLS